MHHEEVVTLNHFRLAGAKGSGWKNRYFLGEARNMGWHLVPVSRRQEWPDLIARWDRNERVHDDIVQAFGYCRVDGNVSDWSFTDPLPCSDVN